MIRVALLGQQFAEQVRANSEELRELDVAWVGSSAEGFRREVPALGIGAAVLDIADMPEVTAEDVRALIETSHAELAVVTYSYRTRSFLRELRAEHVRMLQAPLTLATLRAHLAFLMVQDLLGGRGRRLRADARPTTVGEGGAVHPSGCRCGDELQHVISELIATQARERSCAGRTGGGEAKHQSIESLTQRARDTIEEALQVARPNSPSRGPQSSVR